MISPTNQPIQIPINPISIYGQKIAPSHQAEHVGVVRSDEGNLPHLLGRILSHKKAKFAILSSGISRGHRGNPAAAIVLEKIYALPVLLSGVSSLYLTSWEVNTIDSCYKTTLSDLLKLYKGTPQAFVYFMSGSLPGRALIHQRQLSLFSMICNLRNDPLHQRARHALTCLPPKHKSWFNQIRDICLLYGLPHPLTLLSEPPSPPSFKKLCKSLILDYWETKLRAEVSSLGSLEYFKPEFHSLVKPNPMFWTAASNPYEVSKAIVQCRMLSGRYRTELLASHWSQNKHGYCLQMSCASTIETLAHILLFCPCYSDAREKLKSMWLRFPNQSINHLVRSLLIGPPEALLQFLLDPSVHPDVISMVQELGSEPLKIVFHLTRTWCYDIHRLRAKLLQNWP